MSSLHSLLALDSRPIDESYISELKRLLKSGIPATYTLEQAAAHEAGQEDPEGPEFNTTPLHILVRSLPDDVSDQESKTVLEMMEVLFEYGAGWNFLDFEGKSVGDILWDRRMREGNILYERVVEAGVSAELLLRKLGELMPQPSVEEETGDGEASNRDAAENQETYLNSDLEYTDSALVTKDNRDGVMMDWETDIMRLARDSMFKYGDTSSETGPVVCNIGFGMGIIDTFIQERSPAKHYICEAHPAVLARMRQEGWYDRPGVVVLEGRWQDTLSALLDAGNVFFDAIYYDTFSEHYSDMLDLYDTVVGLLKPEGVFSFFNGLGADRPVCYDVYRRIVEMDLRDYGLKCSFEPVQLSQLPSWKDVRRPYFACETYYHPEIRFA
ncbi:LAMI_0H02982g1_1 [Lachancea mirantina]|uniref:Arginine N-methyltransferase 2 n=1 Tax=Lachancea mirantina TaxID=1230905 RepID=A0A1G4KE47_9SACH|nr:LAMI_0H02982g1_1 [Lachancea mirantina]